MRINKAAALLCLTLTAILAPQETFAIPGPDVDLEDPFPADGEIPSLPAPPGSGFEDDSKDDFETLLGDAQRLLYIGRYIDARAKLQKALKLSPTDYRPHMMLGQYYLFEVSHFKLAYRYLRTAENLFEKRYGSERSGQMAADQVPAHLTLLYLISEAQLNLDKYEDSLKSLDRIEKHPWVAVNGIPDWYPGSRAWVLMKLKRTDEAITVARDGLKIHRADPRRTWNILGILFSVKENRELSLDAFGEAIKAEISLQGFGQVATPLNNAGEVYRELFQDDNAEGSWQRAIRLPDGCEHILPSLNLAILYIDELRLFQAERSLSDFEACFAQQQIRKDTEHRTLLALARGKIALHANDLDKALPLLTVAEQEQQWFGKIGTNENDVEFAAAIAMAQALEAKAEALKDTVRDRIWKDLKDVATIPVLRTRAWWLKRKARRIGLEELDDFEDLFLRNTDTMLEYPTLGTVLAGLRSSSLAKRLERLKKLDNRLDAHTYYDLYLGTNYLEHDAEDDAQALIAQSLQNFREIDRLARAEALAKLIRAKEEDRGWFNRDTVEERQTQLDRKQELFALLPSHLRFNGLSLPVRLQIEPTDRDAEKLLLKVAHQLTSVRFERVDGELKPRARYGLMLSDQPSKDKSKRTVSIHLSDSRGNAQVAVHTAEIPSDGSKTEELINGFIAAAFAHREDPPAPPLKPVPLLQGLFK